VPKISVTINTCNEAHHLRACVASVRPLADEIVVCDMESTDGSADLARELGCKVISHPRMPAPEPEARIAAIKAATGDWILVFDPDMRLSAATCERLRAIAERDEADIVDFYCLNYFFGRWCRHGHGSQRAFRKFFKKACFAPRSTNIQTFWHDSLSGRVLGLGREHAILHHAATKVRAYASTLARYAWREAEQAQDAGVRPSWLRALLRPARRFFGNYFLRLGFLDGFPGLIINLLVARYVLDTEVNLIRMWHDSARR